MELMLEFTNLYQFKVNGLSKQSMVQPEYPYNEGLSLFKLADRKFELIINSLTFMNPYGIDSIRSSKDLGHLNSAEKRIDRVFHFKATLDKSQIEIECFIQKNKLFLKNNLNQILCINLGFWSVLEMATGQLNDYTFNLYVNAKESYLFQAKNVQQLHQFKEKYARIGLLRGFYQDYKPISKLGQGKMASVFLAVNRLNEEKVAVKAFSKKNMMNDPLSTQALRNEIEILKGINNQSLLKFKRLYETEKSYYAITEYVEGKTLRNLIQTQQLSFVKVLVILRKIVQGLDYLASKGIAHRDIKPENIIVGTRDDKVVIVDFGLAVYCRNSKFLYTHCGTPGFVAPEILDEVTYQVSPKSDVFSLGITLHLMLLKKFPYKNTSLSNILEQNREANFQFTSQQYKTIHPLGRRLLQKMLTKDHQSRISAGELLKYFEQRQNWLNQKRVISRPESGAWQNPEDKKQMEKKMVRSSSLRLNFRGRAERIY